MCCWRPIGSMSIGVAFPIGPDTASRCGSSISTASGWPDASSWLTASSGRRVRDRRCPPARTRHDAPDRSRVSRGRGDRANSKDDRPPGSPQRGIMPIYFMNSGPDRGPLQVAMPTGPSPRSGHPPRRCRSARRGLRSRPRQGQGSARLSVRGVRLPGRGSSSTGVQAGAMRRIRWGAIPAGGRHTRAPYSCIAYAARSWNHPAISSRVTSCKAERERRIDRLRSSAPPPTASRP